MHPSSKRRWWPWIAAAVIIVIAAVAFIAVSMHNADWNFEPNGQPSHAASV